MSIFLTPLKEEEREIKSSDLRKRSEVIIIKDDKIFVGIRKPDEYFIPGGGIEKGENAEDTAKREAREEISINCKDLEKLDEIKINWPDIYGGESSLQKLDHKEWLEKNPSLGFITKTYIGYFSSFSEDESGPEDDKYKYKLIDPNEFIKQLNDANKNIKEPERQWRIKENNYIIKCLEKVKQIIEENNKSEE